MPGFPRTYIISTGSELMQGLYPDTNAQGLSLRLLGAGFRVIGHSAVGDSRERLFAALLFASQDSDLIVMTGGLGPTDDDVSRFAVAELYGRQLHRDARALSMIEERFTRRGIPMAEGNAVQAMIPEGATVLYNHWGTAPGFLIRSGKTRPALMALPGPPAEWKPMLEEALSGPLDELFPARESRDVYTLHLAMTPESIAADALRGVIGEHANGSEVTILAHRGHVRLRLLASDAETLRELREEIYSRIGRQLVFAEGLPEVSIAQGGFALLRERRQTLALAESCTGGWLGKAITDIPGSSEVLLAGYITYSNEAKQRDLGVPEELLATHGAVSEATVRAMAQGALHRAGTDWAVAVSGVAGPGGGTEDKPVGTVWFAVASRTEETIARHRLFQGTRDAVREWSVNQAFELLRRAMLGIDPDEFLFPEE